MPIVAKPMWKLGRSTALPIAVILAIVLAGFRALGMLGPPSLRPLLPVGFVVMAITPWILLTREGRREIGFVRPVGFSIYVQAVALGGAAAYICFLLGLILFGTSSDNWFVSVVTNFRQTVATPSLSLLQVYLMFTLPSMVFSPLGEEIFFRGLLQVALENRFSAKVSTWIECVFFGLVHLCHHGIVLSATGLVLLPKSAPIWFVLMVTTAFLFAWLRRRSGSIYPAIASHSAFNFTMGTCIFSTLWVP